MSWCGCWPCVASTVDVVMPRATAHQPGEELARAVAWTWPHGGSRRRWLPSTWPRPLFSKAVGEYAPEQVNRLAKLKKADIASEAERLAEGSGWMPAMFKAAGPEAAGGTAGAGRPGVMPETMG